MSAPVTVSITRTLSPGHHDEMLAWIRAGSALAARFDGFLGSGWVRPSTQSEEWHMLYRFADELARDLGGLAAARVVARRRPGLSVRPASSARPG